MVVVNYYDILEISENASAEVIQSAYRALAKKYHPDTYKGDLQYANSMMQTINEAYEILSDATKRHLYDAQLKSAYQHKSDTESTKETNSRSTTESTSHVSEKPTYSAIQKPKKGCLSGCLSNLLGFIFWLVVIALCLNHCSKKDGGQGVFDDLKKAVTSATAPTPLSDRYDQLVEETLQEALQADSEEERKSKFTDTLTLQASEYCFKVNAYLHYVDDSYENQPFSNQMTEEMLSTVNTMKQFFSDEIVTITVAACIDVAFDFYEGMQGRFDYMLGDGWTKRNIDLDYLWELYLSQTDIYDYMTE